MQHKRFTPTQSILAEVVFDGESMTRDKIIGLRVSRDTYVALKELLCEASSVPKTDYNGPLRNISEESSASRAKRETLRPVFDQLRDVDYDDLV